MAPREEEESVSSYGWLRSLMCASGQEAVGTREMKDNFYGLEKALQVQAHTHNHTPLDLFTSSERKKLYNVAVKIDWFEERKKRGKIA